MNFFEGEHAHGSPSTTGSAAHGNTASESASRGAVSALAAFGAASGSTQSREKKEKMMV